VRELGRGGTARVYLAVQQRYGRTVALKVVADDLAGQADFRQSFTRESRINAQLTHPSIVQIHDVGAHEDLLYLVMEYVSGGDLMRRLERGMRIENMLREVREIGPALDFAHGRGFLHRDIKPENILFREDGSAVLSDFGIARAILGTPSLSRSGTVLGTPQYMSPEQLEGDSSRIDIRTDVYSLGVVLYELLTGRLPYDMRRKTAPEAVRIVRDEDPLPLTSADRTVRGDVVAITTKCLEKAPARRYSSAAELTSDIERHLDGQLILAGPPTFGSGVLRLARRHRRAAAASLAALVAGLVALVAIGIFAAHAERQRAAAVRATARAERGRLAAEA
jgi:serine/threonine-protein kinase PpkA